MNFLQKLRNQPERIRKIILWLIIIILGISLLTFWFKNVQEKIKSFQGKEIIKELKLPEIKMPETGVSKEEIQEKIKELNELINEAEGQATSTEE